MKSVLKRLARPLWRITAPVRRPFLRKFDQHMMQLLGPYRSPAVPGELDRVLHTVVHELARSRGGPHDLDLVLNSVVRELARLQMQVEILQGQIDDLQPIDRDEARTEGRLSLVAEIG